MGTTADMPVTAIASSTMIAPSAVAISPSTTVVPSTPLSSSVTSSVPLSSSVTSSVPPTPTPSPTAPDSLQDTEARTLQLIQNEPQFSALLVETPLMALENLEQLVNVSQDTPVESLTAVYLLGRILQNIPPGETVPVETSEAALSVVNCILEQSITADGDNVTDDDEVAGSSLLQIMENLAFAVDGLNDSTGVQLEQEQIVLRAFTVASNSSDNETDTVAISVEGNELTLPNSLFRALNSNTVQIGLLFYRNISGLLPGIIDNNNSTTLASSVLASSVRCSEGNCSIPSAPPVRIVLQHSPDIEAAVADGASTLCVFWDFDDVSGEVLSSGGWSEEGCSRNGTLSNSSVTVCECSHLTNFAILLSPTAVNFTEAQSISLKAIGAIGTAFSIIAMALTVVTFIILRSQWNMRNYIHINLCVSLSIAQLIFVAGVTPVGEGGVSPGCRAVAVLLHYFFLATFMWMLMEGVVLYVLLVKVFVTNQRPYIIGFTIASYGVPLLYLCLTLPLGFALRPDDPDYGYAEACWLNPSTHFVFSFIAPVIIIILVNIGFFIMALVIARKHHRNNKNNTIMDNAVHWMKGAVSLLVVMGIVWIMGVLVLQVDALLPVAYIFTILFAFQGVFIFVLFVLLQKPVRDAYKKWWKVNVSKHRRDKNINLDFLKLGSGNSTIQSVKSNGTLKSNTNTIGRNDDSSKDVTGPALELKEKSKKDLGGQSGQSGDLVIVL